MPPKDATPASPPDSAPVDSGLRCPACDYNLTGLTEPRCPECGTAFSWETVRAATEHRPTIAFERARGWRKVPAFVVTWATVLFAPWIFARQIVQRVSAPHGVAFIGFCFAGTTLGYLTGMDLEFHATWLSTALVYILLQMLWLSVLDPTLWHDPLATLRFWLLASCYTSAVMLTEFVDGPPPLFLTDFWELISTGDANTWLSDLYQFNLSAIIHWIQLALWLIALGCVYAKRVARGRASALIIALAVIVSFSLLNLYAAAVEWIGGNISEWIDGWL